MNILSKCSIPLQNCLLFFNLTILPMHQVRALKLSKSLLLLHSIDYGKKKNAIKVLI